MNTSAERENSIKEVLVNYVLERHPSRYDRQTLPRDQSLVDLGVIDSFGVVELIAFIEDYWKFSIADEEITTEHLGGIDRMAQFVLKKTVGA